MATALCGSPGLCACHESSGIRVSLEPEWRLSSSQWLQTEAIPDFPGAQAEGGQKLQPCLLNGLLPSSGFPVLAGVKHFQGAFALCSAGRLYTWPVGGAKVTQSFSAYLLEGGLSCCSISWLLATLHRPGYAASVCWLAPSPAHQWVSHFRVPQSRCSNAMLLLIAGLYLSPVKSTACVKFLLTARHNRVGSGFCLD